MVAELAPYEEETFPFIAALAKEVGKDVYVQLRIAIEEDMDTQSLLDHFQLMDATRKASESTMRRSSYRP